MDADSDDEESEYEKQKYHALNITEDKNISWKGINDKVVCYRCGKSGHTKEKIFR